MSRDANQVGFRRLTHEDLPLMHRWLNAPHVDRWWDEAGTLEEVSEQYSKYVTGEEKVEPYLILHDGIPAGYIQSYRHSDHEEWDPYDIEGGAVGLDLFIGEPSLLYRGLGPEILRLFMEREVFSDPSTNLCLIDPEPENGAGIRAYEKVGFRHFRTFEGPWGPAYLMRLYRRDFERRGSSSDER